MILDPVPSGIWMKLGLLPFNVLTELLQDVVGSKSEKLLRKKGEIWLQWQWLYQPLETILHA